MSRIAIVGGGASGMMAAIAASRRAKESGAKAEITIIEKNARLGKKLLSTGNGRCNITNMSCTAANFHGQSPGFAATALAAFGVGETLRFFDGIGLICKETAGGRVYPYCGQASAVLDILRTEVLRRGIVVLGETEVVTADLKQGSFRLSLKYDKCAAEFVTCDKLIIAAGGKAAPSTGSGGRGFELLAGFGHRIIEPWPALCPLKTETALAAAMQGVRIDGAAWLESSGAASEGEIQFAAYGLTGPAILDISGAALSQRNDAVILDLMPEFSEGELIKMLKTRRDRLGDLALESFLTGFLSKKVGQMLIKAATGRKLSTSADSLSDSDIEKLTGMIKSLRFPVHGHTGWENAQVTAGGADTSEFSPETMESKIVSGLYAVGEVLDIYGDCGGHNLQWAWSSGHAAGTSVIKC